MFIFTILALMALFLIIFAIIVISLGGAVGLIVFSDVIVCAVILGLLIKFLFFKKKK